MRLLDEVRRAMRARHYSPRTEQVYVGWMKRYFAYHGMRHPAELGAEHVNAFLAWLATDRHVAASTQNQALAAITFLYNVILGKELDVGAFVPSARSVCLSSCRVRAPAHQGRRSAAPRKRRA